MFFRKKSVLVILFSIHLCFILLFTSCDDSSTEEEEVQQVEFTIPEARADDRKALYNKWNGTFPVNWTRSGTPYSSDSATAFSADVIINTYQKNWQGKWIYLAHNFKNEDGEKMYDDIIFFFDNMTSCIDGYYIYLNTLPLEE